jgi:hypothetical protein
MALKNGKSLKTTIKIFIKENGREPDFQEFRKLLKGESAKEKEASVANETESK